MDGCDRGRWRVEASWPTWCEGDLVDWIEESLQNIPFYFILFYLLALFLPCFREDDLNQLIIVIFLIIRLQLTG